MCLFPVFPLLLFLRLPGSVVVVGFVGSAFGVISVVFYPPGPSMFQFVFPMCPAHGPCLLLGAVVIVGFVCSASEVLSVFSSWFIRDPICFSKVSGSWSSISSSLSPLPVDVSAVVVSVAAAAVSAVAAVVVVRRGVNWGFSGGEHQNFTMKKRATSVYHMVGSAHYTFLKKKAFCTSELANQQRGGKGRQGIKGMEGMEGMEGMQEIRGMEGTGGASSPNYPSVPSFPSVPPFPFIPSNPVLPPA